jgi:hypothetical protein
MGDEIHNANVARVEQIAPGRWRATLGPSPAYGLSCEAPNAASALVRLAVLSARSWCYDPYWRDLPARPYGDATDH